MVEEHIQPAHIQREVECLNEDIFKHLLADDLKRTNEVEMPTYVMPTYDDRLTTSSNEDEVHISGDVLHRKQPNTNTYVLFIQLFEIKAHMSCLFNF